MSGKYKMSTPYSENGKASEDVGYSSTQNTEATYFGRSVGSWAKISLFYTVFYSGLVVFCAICFAGFLSSIDQTVPTLIGMESLIKGNPGMSYRPQPDKKSTVIKFISDNINQTQPLVDSINSRLSDYVKQQADNTTEMVDCDDEIERSDVLNGTFNKVCKFDLALLGDECTDHKHFGYSLGKPCVLLKLNKIYGWEPELYQEGDEKIPELIKDKINPNGMPVTCEGENYGDRDNIGEITVFPKDGFLKNSFPFMNGKNYQSPLVMVQFENLQPAVPIQIWCKVWARNVYHHKNDKAGSIHIEMFKVF